MIWKKLIVATRWNCWFSTKSARFRYNASSYRALFRETERKRSVGCCVSGFVIRLKAVEIIQEHCENWFFLNITHNILQKYSYRFYAQNLPSKNTFTQSGTANPLLTQNVVTTSGGRGGAIKRVGCGGYLAKFVLK